MAKHHNQHLKNTSIIPAMNLEKPQNSEKGKSARRKLTKYGNLQPLLNTADETPSTTINIQSVLQEYTTHEPKNLSEKKPIKGQPLFSEAEQNAIFEYWMQTGHSIIYIADHLKIDRIHWQTILKVINKKIRIKK